MKTNNVKIKKKLFIGVLFLMSFLLLLTVNSNAATEMPKITISGESDSLVTGEMVDSYTLTIDYSQISDLTNLQLYYKVDDGNWKNVTYDDSKTNVEVSIRGGMDGFTSNKALHKISVYAENDVGKSETLEKEVLFYYFADKTLTNTDYDVTVKTFQYPLNSSLEVEIVTDKNILSKIPLENMTLYKITIKADSQLAGPLVKKYKKHSELSRVNVTVPLSESVKKAIENGVSKDKVGYSFNKEYKYEQTVKNFAEDTNYFEFISTYTKQILDDGYVYLAIATGETSTNTDDENTNNTITDNTNKNETKDNTTASGKLPQTGVTFSIIFVLAVISIVCAMYTVIKIKGMKNID